MDDWFTIVLAFLFIVVPLLEGLFKKSKKGPPPSTRSRTNPYQDSTPAPDGVEPALPRGRGTASADDSSWSDGWGSWPGEVLEEEDEAEETVPSWSGPESPERHRAASRPAELSSAPLEIPTRAPEPVVVPEAAKSPELERLQELAARLDRVALTEGTSATPPNPARVAAPPKPRRAPRQGMGLLNDRASVRHALIVSEVLGPPLAVRDRPQV